MIFTSKKLYKEAVKIGADIYQIHDPELLPYAAKLKKKGKVVIFDSHEFYGIQIEIKEYIPKMIRKLIAKLYMSYEAYICKKLDAVIAVCTINNVNYFENRSNHTIFIENLPDNNVFNKDFSKNDNKSNTAVYVGTLAHVRGITHLVKAIAQTPANLILCGPFSSKEYYEEIKSYPEYTKVDYRGVISRNEIAAILSESYVGISTILDVGQYPKVDTLNTKVYEYMSMGLPVIISDYTYARKVMEEYEFGICVDPENIDDVADQITFLLNNPTIAQRMGENGVKAIREKYNWNIEERKLIDLYKGLIN
ncbi:glycosyltransferase [Bacillus sp. FJAT-29790]|nr:glycosyltransferase [Bacillus sp. FJAT-29790]